MIKFNEEDFICCSEFKCEQDYNDFVEAVSEMGYDVYEPSYKQDVVSGTYKYMVFGGVFGEFSAACEDVWKGEEYTLKEILSSNLSEEAQALRKMLLRAVKDVEEGKLTSIDDFLESI